VNAMLLNEFLKEHRRVEEQGNQMRKQDQRVQQLEATIAQQQRDFQSTISQLQSALKEQAAQIQQISAQVQTNKPTSRLALNNEEDRRTN